MLKIVHGWIAYLHSLLRIFKAAQITGISLFSAQLLIPDIYKISRGVENHLEYFINTHIIGKILCSHVGCSRRILFLKEGFFQEHNSLVLQDLNKKYINYIVAR